MSIKNTTITASLKASQLSVSKNMTKLATNKAINSSGDGAAKFAKKTSLTSAIQSSKITLENMQGASSLLNSVEGFMGRIEENIIKAKELALAYENGDGKEIKGMISKEFNNTVENINNISNSAKFGNKKVLMDDYSHTVSIANTALGLKAAHFTFSEREGPDNKPVEMSYNANSREFTLARLDGNGSFETASYEAHKSSYFLPKSGVTFTVPDTFDPLNSFNVEKGISFDVKTSTADLVGKISNFKLIGSQGGLDKKLTVGDFNKITTGGAVNNATIELGGTFSVEGIDFSEGNYSDRTITLTTAAGEKAVFSYNWTLHDVERNHAASDVAFPSNPLLTSLDYTVDFERKSDSGISMSFQSGIRGSANDTINISYDSIDTFNLGLDDVNLSEDASSVINKLDVACFIVASQRANIGMTLASVDTTKATLASTVDQYNNTLDSIDNVDTADVTTELAISKAMVEMSIALVGQINEQAAQYNSLVR